MSMHFRFRKRFRLFGGVHLNVGKSGASLSFGPRGAHVTVGPRGTTTSLGLPGSGMSLVGHHRNREDLQ